MNRHPGNGLVDDRARVGVAVAQDDNRPAIAWDHSLGSPLIAKTRRSALLEPRNLAIERFELGRQELQPRGEPGIQEVGNARAQYTGQLEEQQHILVDMTVSRRRKDDRAARNTEAAAGIDGTPPFPQCRGLHSAVSVNLTDKSQVRVRPPRLLPHRSAPVWATLRLELSAHVRMPTGPS